MPDPRLDHLHAVVEASSFERLMLWSNHAADSGWRPARTRLVLSWESDSSGFIRQIGEIAGMPVTIGVAFAVIDGKPIAFCDAPSAVVDWRMVKDWICRFSERCSDAQNFHNALAGDACPDRLARFREAQEQVRAEARARWAVEAQE